MRLRTSQFVFLLLLVCSVQHLDECALHLNAGAVPGRSSTKAEHRDVGSAVVPQHIRVSKSVDLPSLEPRLDAASRAAHAVIWPVRRPALESAAVSSFTGFLRA